MKPLLLILKNIQIGYSSEFVEGVSCSKLTDVILVNLGGLGEELLIDFGVFCELKLLHFYVNIIVLDLINVG